MSVALPTKVAGARPTASLAEDVRVGLCTRPRQLPPKYFYDERGSQLFDAICDTPEYYPTRTEASLLRRYAAEIIATAVPSHIMELGAGAARKSRILLDAWSGKDSDRTFWPFDVSGKFLAQVAEELQADYDWLNVCPLVGDYTAGLGNLPRHDGAELVVFLGSTIGNFEPTDALNLVRELRQRARDGDFLLLGMDRHKDTATLEAAYNDAAGYTAAFNLNLIHVLNRELDAALQTEDFRHIAIYNEAERQIEMYLEAKHDTAVALPRANCEFRMVAGERILTEISRKFTLDRATLMLEQAGFGVVRHFAPDDQAFSLILAKPI